MKKVTVGIIGSGFAGALHAHSYNRVFGLEVRLKTVASLDKTIEEFAKKYNIESTCSDYREILADPEIDVVDIITPVVMHAPMIKEAIAAGKHVICEKPLSGYCKVEGDRTDIGNYIDKQTMLSEVTEELKEIERIVKASDRLFMYAENWIYMPSIIKAEEIITKRKSKILMIKGEESHSGSHASHAAQWRYSAGGSFIRQGCHPLSAAIYLKKAEGRLKGKEIKVESVVADMGYVVPGLTEEEKKYLSSRPVDVEDIGNVILTFTDGTKANIIAGDMVVGGVKNLIEVYANDMVLQCNAAPNNSMAAYFTNGAGLDNIYITEKIENKTGWQQVQADEEASRGYNAEIQDFLECVAYGKEPKSGFDLAYETTLAVYAAYASAESGRRIMLNL